MHLRRKTAIKFLVLIKNKAGDRRTHMFMSVLSCPPDRPIIYSSVCTTITAKSLDISSRELTDS